MSNTHILPLTALKGALARRVTHLDSLPKPEPVKYKHPSRETLRRWRKSPPYGMQGPYVFFDRQNMNDVFHYLAYIEGETEPPKPRRKKKHRAR